MKLVAIRFNEKDIETINQIKEYYLKKENIDLNQSDIIRSAIRCLGERTK
jgi:hypothetical protein